MDGKIIYDILINIVGFLIGVVLTWFASLIKRKRSKSELRDFWTGKTKNITIVYGTRDISERLLNKDPEPSNIDIFEVVNTNDVNAIAEASSYLHNISEVSIASHNMPLSKDSNLFILGGPLANKLTEEFVDRLKPDFYFFDLQQGKRDIRNRGETAIFRSYFDKQERIIKDVGWFIRDLNPLNNESIVVIGAGSFGYGTHAVVHCLTSDKYLKKIRRAIKNSKKQRIEGIIVVDIENEHMTITEFILHE